MKITANFTMEEMTKCSRAGIENIPDAAATVALKNLTINVLQPIRDNFKKSVNISCAYRCTEYNNFQLLLPQL